MGKTVMKPNVVQQPDKPEVPTEVFAQHIIEVHEGMRKIMAGSLRQDTIILLIHDITKLPRRDIKKVLDACTVLAPVYLKPKVK